MRRHCTMQSVCHSITSGEQQRLGQQRSVITACFAPVVAMSSAPHWEGSVGLIVAFCCHLACLPHSAEPKLDCSCFCVCRLCPVHDATLNSVPVVSRKGLQSSHSNFLL